MFALSSFFSKRSPVATIFPNSFRKLQAQQAYVVLFSKTRIRMKTMTPSSCRRLQNKFTVNTWTESPPSSLQFGTTWINIYVPYLTTPVGYHQKLNGQRPCPLLRLPVSRNLDAKGLCCVLRCHHGIRRRPLRQVLCSSRKSIRRSVYVRRLLPFERHTIWLDGLVIASRAQNITTHTSWTLPSGHRNTPGSNAWFPSSGRPKILRRFYYGLCLSELRNVEV